MLTPTGTVLLQHKCQQRFGVVCWHVFESNADTNWKKDLAEIKDVRHSGNTSEKILYHCGRFHSVSVGTAQKTREHACTCDRRIPVCMLAIVGFCIVMLLRAVVCGVFIKVVWKKLTLYIYNSCRACARVR